MTAIRFLNSGKVLSPELPFSEAVQVGDFLILSGQMGVAPGTMTLVPGGLAAEARQALENIRLILEAHGATLSQVVKCTVMLTDMSRWGEFNAIYREFFTPPYPARAAFGVNALALGGQVEIDCIAHVTEAQ